MEKEKRVLVMKSGKRYPVIGEDTRYWKCKGTQFRKSNPNIATVKTQKEKGGE